MKIKLHKKNKLIKFAKITFALTLCLTITAISFGLAYVFNISKNIQFDEQIIYSANAKLHIFDNQNNDITKHNSQESKISLDELPSYIPASFISIEDKNFFNHDGLNYKRILKAIYKNFVTKNATEGASTISQQLIKNTHLSSEKTISRKVKEVILTKKMENKLSKKIILETYLNAIYFGNGAYGIDNASKIYFNKPASMLTIEESAMLAGMIKSPKKYSPILNYENCLKRRNLVLNEMLKDGVIANKQHADAINTKINIDINLKGKQNYYEQAVILEATKILNISEKDLALGNYYIFTYFDNNAQQYLENAVNNESYYHKNTYGNIPDSASIIIDNKTGGIVAFGGKSNYDLVNMKRSPGSSIKPILVYAPALENGIISPISPILDEKTTFDGYSPQNVGNKYYGYVSATESLEKSLNIPAIKIVQAKGIKNSKLMAEKSGIEFDKNDTNYAICLGGLTNGTTVKQLVNSYIPFANNGKFIDAKFIKKICDKNGKLIYENNCKQTLVMSEETAYLATEMMISGVKKGTSSKLKDLSFEIAGKTGTVGLKNTNLNTDVWSVAYTTDYTAGCWLGNSTGNAEYMLEGCNNGGTYCTLMLKNIFENLHQTNKPNKFTVPDGIEIVNLDSQELENNHKLALADSNTPEIFITKASFNKKYKPKLVAKSFDELKAVNISANIENNVVKLNFIALPQVEYKIVRINDDEMKVINIVKNKKGNFTVEDDKIFKGEFYTYYIEAVAKNHSTNTAGKRIRSNSVKVYLDE